MKILAISMLFAVSLFATGCGGQKDGVSQKPRTIVTCDPELDDNNSMIRFILHSTDFQIDGLVYTSSRFHWRGDTTSSDSAPRPHGGSRPTSASSTT